MDGVGYQHKYNPLDQVKSVKSMTWQQQSESLEPLCTAKGSHTGSGQRIAQFILAISFNKRVILCEQYFGKIMKKCLQISNINILKKLLKKVTIQRTNSPFRMVVHHKTAEMPIMPCTKWGPENSVYQHGVHKTHWKCV